MSLLLIIFNMHYHCLYYLSFIIFPCLRIY